MRRYENLTKSEFHWINEYPASWKLGRIKNNTYVKARIGWQGLRSDEFILNSDWYCVTGTDFKNGTIDWENCYCVEKERYDQDKKIQLKIDDLLITKDGTIGKIALIKELPKKTTLNSGVFVTRPLMKTYNVDYFYWVLSSNVFREFIDYHKNGSTILHLYQNVFERFIFLIPSVIEQQSIAQYLDTKTEAIDKKVSFLEKKIEGYKKLKNTIIAKAVTQGIKNEQLKTNDLGFKTVRSWTKSRLKDIGKLYSGLSGKSGDDFNQDNNPHNKGFIPFTNIANNVYLDKEHLGTVVINSGEKQNKVKKGDLFFLMSSEGYEDIGKTAVLADELEEAYLNSFCKGYRVNPNKCNPYFLNYLLLSNIYRQRLIVEGKGFTRINLKMEKVTDFEVYIPKSLEEQQAIASYLDTKTSTIDKIVANIQTQITTLKTLRKTLINDVVTGKIKVCDD
ncbi:restriction endonuclease subunit S [Sphingobacterium spiritivorum]|uniref:restriction endonuclease subunit S n=1 Tax=Sphingobacterium spiritivorum TaxID=258 RepID=UPI003DA4878B